MARSVETITDNVLAYGFAPSMFTSVIHIKIDEAVNICFRRTKLRKRSTKESIKVVTETQGYELPADFGELISVYLAEGEEDELKTNLTALTSTQEFDELEEETGEPTRYIIIENQIKLWPIPDGTERHVVIRYWKNPSSIAEESTKTPEVGDQFLNLIEYYCIAECFAKEGDIDMHNFWKGKFDLGLIEFSGFYNTDTRTGNEQVEGYGYE